MDRFVIKKRKVQLDHESSEDVNRDSSSTEHQNNSAEIEVMVPPSTSTLCDQVSKTLNKSSRDIGTYIGDILRLNDHTKYELFTNHWQPNKNYNFPTSLHVKRGREEQRRVNTGHFDKYPWLVFSELKNGLFCKYCAIFCDKKLAGGQQTVPLRKLVTEPLQKYAKLSGKDGDLESHGSTSYHKEAELDAKSFIYIFVNPKQEIRNVINETRKSQVTQNRARLVPIIKTLLLHGRQNIPLRGHRDDGSLLEENEEPVHNDGNFRALLRFRIDSGDVQLEEHLKSSGANATYISKTTANDLIHCCGQEILETIKQRVSKAKYYSVIFYETTDASHTSQLSLSLRYVHENVIREDFVGFLDLHKMNYSDAEVEPIITGEILGRSVLQFMQNLSLNLNNCVGISCDGCSVNMSDMRGAVSEIQKIAKNSVLCGCKNHALNLSISKCNKNQSVRNAVGCIKEVTSFFNMSAKRNFVLKNILGHQMRGYCETRWVERHQSIIEFKEDLPKIVDALRTVSMWKDTASASKANCLLNSLLNCDFIITIYCLSDVTDMTLVLSKYLQSETIDLCSAKEKVTNTLNGLKSKRDKSHEYFSIIFDSVEKLMTTLDIDLRVPRLANKQCNRPNYPTASSDDRENTMNYWKRSVYIPMLDNIITDMTDRFTDDSLKCYSLNILVPKSLDSVSDLSVLKSFIEPIVEMYSPVMLLNRDTMYMKVVNEICSLKNMSTYSNFKIITKPMKCFVKLDENCFPILKDLLQILFTLPISIATAERTFSTLRRLKSWMRARMTEDRLTGLALKNVHTDIDICIERVINRFASTKNRKLDFVL